MQSMKADDRRQPGAGSDDCHSGDSRPSAGAASREGTTPSMEGRSHGSALVVGQITEGGAR